MDPFTIAMLGSAALSGWQGYKKGKESDAMNKKALEQSEYDYNMRAPLRRQGMQALGQIEAPMDMGNIGFNAANPFAAARGPAKSTASLGDWGRFTTSPETIDNAISGVSDADLEWAQKALTQKRPDGSFVYKTDERNHAQKEIMDKANTRLGMAGGGTIQDAMTRRGITALGTSAEDQARNPGRFGYPGAPTGRTATPRRGMMALGGGR